VIALDANTGKRIWHYQIVRHDLLDYDNPSAPTIATIKKDGKEIDVVVHRNRRQSTRSGGLSDNSAALCLVEFLFLRQD
jgi:quinoprotein glucose dehydrogenase